MERNKASTFASGNISLVNSILEDWDILDDNSVKQEVEYGDIVDRPNEEVKKALIVNLEGSCDDISDSMPSKAGSEFAEILLEDDQTCRIHKGASVTYSVKKEEIIETEEEMGQETHGTCEIFFVDLQRENFQQLQKQKHFNRVQSILEDWDTLDEISSLKQEVEDCDIVDKSSKEDEKPLISNLEDSYRDISDIIPSEGGSELPKSSLESDQTCRIHKGTSLANSIKKEESIETVKEMGQETHGTCEKLFVDLQQENIQQLQTQTHFNLNQSASRSSETKLKKMFERRLDKRSGKVLFKCLHCQFQSIYLKDMIGHINNKHQNGSEMVECDRRSYPKTETQERICGLCLKVCDNFKAIEGDMKDVLDVVLPKIDVGAIQELVVCTDCTEMLIKCSTFKTTCLNTYNYIISFTNDRNDLKLNLRDVYLSKNDSVAEDYAICGFCMDPVKNCSAISLDVDKGDVLLEKMIGQCLPELDLSLIEKPVICAPCHGSLKNCFYFVMNCLCIEEKIKKYCETQDLNSRGQIDLSRLLEFTARDVATGVVNGNPVDTIKEETQFCEEKENSDERIIDNEGDIFKFQQSTCADSENAAEEDKKFDEIEILETYCGEDETLFKEENLNEMEDDEFLESKEDAEMKTDEPDSIKKYCETQDLNSRGQIDLSRLLEFTARDVATGVVNGNPVDTIKEETQFFEEKENSDERIIDNEGDIFKFQQSACADSENAADEDKKFDEIEILETFCGEDETLFKEENLIEMKDDEFLESKEDAEMKTDEPDLIKKNCETQDLNSRGQIDLSRLLEFTARGVATGMVNGNPVDTIKEETQFCEEKENSDERIIDNEGDIFKFQQSTCADSENAAEEDKKFDEIEIPETFCGADETLFKEENLIEMEDDEFLESKEDAEMKTDEPDSIKKCCETQDLNSRSQIELSRLLEFTARDVATGMVNGNPVDTIKEETQFCEEKENSDERIIDNEGDIFKFQQSTCADSENAAEEDKKFDEIEIPETFCGEDETLFKEENLIKMEDDEFLESKEDAEMKTDEPDSIRFEEGLDMQPSEVATINCKLYKCDFCSYQATVKRNFKRHQLVHMDSSEVTIYACDLCPFQTKRKYDLKSHSLKHKDLSEVTVYKCNFCPYQTRQKDYLKSHFLKHKDPSEVTLYKCDFCPYQTKRKVCLRRHLLMHKDPSEVTRHKCNFCPYQTKRKYYLEWHLLKHKDLSEVTVYKCYTCSFQTRYKYYLKEHIQIHMGPAKVSKVSMYIKCNFCPYQTKRKDCIKAHLLTHNCPSKVHKCDSCPYRTREKDRMLTHFLKHKDPSEVTVYTCDICSFQSKYKKSLSKHLLIHKRKKHSEVTVEGDLFISS